MGRITGKEIKSLSKQLYQIKLDIPQIKKIGTNTCWAGCYRMIDTYHNNIHRFDYYLKIKSKTCSSNHCYIKPCKTCDQPRLTKDVLGDLLGLAFKKTVHHASHLKTPEIIKCLQSNSPLMIFKDNGPNIGHFVLISGVTNKHNFENKLLIINDPDKDRTDIIDIADACLTGGIWKETWVVKK